MDTVGSLSRRREGMFHGSKLTQLLPDSARPTGHAWDCSPDAHPWPLFDILAMAVGCRCNGRCVEAHASVLSAIFASTGGFVVSHKT